MDFSHFVSHSADAMFNKIKREKFGAEMLYFNSAYHIQFQYAFKKKGMCLFYEFRKIIEKIRSILEKAALRTRIKMQVLISIISV